jgi:hypothetical protein
VVKIYWRQKMIFELEKIFIENDLVEFISIFEENNLDREILSELTESDYKKLGIPEGAITKMLKLFSTNSSNSEEHQKNIQGNTNSTLPTAPMEQIVPTEITHSFVASSPVHTMLIDNGLSEYVAIFDQHKLTSFDIVSKLTESELSELGIHAIGDRKKIKELFTTQNNPQTEIIPYSSEATPYIKDANGTNNNNENKYQQPTVVIENKSGGGSGIHGAVGGIIGAIIGVIIAGTLIFWIIGNILRVL